MPQMMGPGRLHPGGNRQIELWDELMKDMADGLRAEGTPRWRIAQVLALQRRLDEYLVEDQPAEEAAQGTQQGVDAAWLAGMRQHKGLQHRWCDRLQGRHLLDEQVALQLT